MITNDRLKQLSDKKTICVCRDEEYQEMAKELLTLRQQFSGAWLAWDGGVRPVPCRMRVKVKFRNGAFMADYSEHFEWSKDNSELDIIAYRLL